MTCLLSIYFIIHGEVKILRKLALIMGIILFVLGIVFGLIINSLPVLSNIQGMSLWGTPNLVSFDPTLEKEGVIDYIHCPLLITPNEEKQIKVFIRNSTDVEINQSLLFIASDPIINAGYLSDHEKLALEPNELVNVSRPLLLHEITGNHLISIRVFLFQDKSTIASSTRHCGILLYQVGNLNGNQIIFLAIGLFMILTTGGMILWWFTSQSYQRPRLINRLLWISGALSIGLTIHLFRWQFLAIIWLILSILIIVSIIEESLMGRII